jgi:hypothetical protein
MIMFAIITIATEVADSGEPHESGKPPAKNSFSGLKSQCFEHCNLGN